MYLGMSSTFRLDLRRADLRAAQVDDSEPEGITSRKRQCRGG
jgi:hypothetical protein